jgi:hypothetical protein
MRLLSALPLAVASQLATAAAAADDGFRLRFSPSLGAGLIYPLPPENISRKIGLALTLDLTVEAGPLFFGAIALVHEEGIATGVVENAFLGARLGYVLGTPVASLYASGAAGRLAQTVVFLADRGTQSQNAGLAFELEAGLILFRRPGLGRVWLFGFALLPTFDVRNDPGFPDAWIPSIGLGVRLGL